MKSETGGSFIKWIVILGLLGAGAYFAAQKWGAPVAQVVTSNAGDAKNKLDKAQEAVDKANRAAEEMNRKVKDAMDKQ